MSSLVYKLLLSLCLCLRHYRGYVYGSSSSYHAPHVKDGLHNWGVIAWLLWTTDSPHVLLFTVDRDTHEFFCRLQSNVFDAASLFQTNHVVHWMHHVRTFFSVRRHGFFVLRDVHSQRVYLQEGSLPCYLSAIELSAWPLFISWR